MDQSATTSLEEYARVLEMKLTMKSGLLDEAVRLHRSLEVRLAALEDGLSWKDVQLEALVRQSEAACHGAAMWQERAERLEEDNCVLRDALLEHADKNEQLQQLLKEVQARQQHSPTRAASVAAATSLAASPLLEGRGDAAAGDDTASEETVRRLTRKLRESCQRVLLLEEQLRIRSGSDSLGSGTAPELGVLPDLGSLPPSDAWAAVGRGAADRLCGAVPHAEIDFARDSRPSIGSLIGYRNGFTGSTAPRPEALGAGEGVHAARLPEVREMPLTSSRGDAVPEAEVERGPHESRAAPEQGAGVALTQTCSWIAPGVNMHLQQPVLVQGVQDDANGPFPMRVRRGSGAGLAIPYAAAPQGAPAPSAPAQQGLPFLQHPSSAAGARAATPVAAHHLQPGPPRSSTPAASPSSWSNSPRVEPAPQPPAPQLGSLSVVQVRTDYSARSSSASPAQVRMVA